MPRIDVPKIIDDHDGKELPADTKPTNLSYMGQRYKLYLSEANSEKLFEFLHTFTKDADVEYDVQKARQKKADDDHDEKKANAERSKKVRHWALENNVEVDGKPLGERGRVPDAFVEKWEKAGSPGIG